MHTIKLIFCSSFIALLACGSNAVLSQNEFVFPLGDQGIEPELVFGQQITGSHIQRTISHDGSMLAIVNTYKLQVWDLIKKRMISEIKK